MRIIEPFIIWDPKPFTRRVMLWTAIATSWKRPWRIPWFYRRIRNARDRAVRQEQDPNYQASISSIAGQIREEEDRAIIEHLMGIVGEAE